MAVMQTDVEVDLSCREVVDLMLRAHWTRWKGDCDTPDDRHVD